MQTALSSFLRVKRAKIFRLLPTVLLLITRGAPAIAAPAADALRNEPSAFLRAHADSPVAWMTWGAPAFARAKQENKPVFVFIGAFASELSRAMRQQTFSNPDAAKLLNENFVCVLVDREEHPELAALYQAYVSEVRQLHGWPLNLWLTPELQPFEGATYLPPSEEWGKASFLKVAQQTLTTWTADPAGYRTRAAEASARLAAPTSPPAASSPENLSVKLANAAAAWRASFDAAHGGFGDPPKSPEPELLRFLLRQSPADRDAALATLRALATSALRDPLDGGFFRNATDAAWRVPNQQKNLADQARLALAFLDAATGDDTKNFAPPARGALDYALTRLAQPDGTFAAGEDATADDFAGYYAWTEAEIDAALGADAAAFKRAHAVESAGNVAADDDLSGRFKGKNLLRSAATADDAPAARLLAVRNHRPAPPRDDRATVGAHGLLLAALSRAGAQLGEPRYAAAAARTFDAIKKIFLVSPDGDLRRLRGSATPAAPADYAALALGCREFARGAHRPEADALATRLLSRAGRLYFDAATGRYYATPAALPPGIFVRPLAAGDPPSAESLALLAGGPAEPARAMTAALSASLDETGEPAPGDVLLALSLSPSN